MQPCDCAVATKSKLRQRTQLERQCLASFQPFVDAVWMYFMLRFLEVRKTGGDWRDVFLFGDGFKMKVAPESRECFSVLDLNGDVEFAATACQA